MRISSIACSILELNSHDAVRGFVTNFGSTGEFRRHFQLRSAFYGLAESCGKFFKEGLLYYFMFRLFGDLFAKVFGISARAVWIIRNIKIFF